VAGQGRRRQGGIVYDGARSGTGPRAATSGARVRSTPARSSRALRLSRRGSHGGLANPIQPMSFRVLIREILRLADFIARSNKRQV